MSVNFNDPKYPFIEDNQTGEGHLEPEDQSIKSNVKGIDHPTFSSSGLMNLINRHRNLGNSQEKELSGEIKPETFKQLISSAKKNKVPFTLLAFCCDFDTDLTSGASKAEAYAKKIVENRKSLVSSLGGDPTFGELFASVVLESPDKVKEIKDLATQKPDEEAQPLGSKKDSIIINKNRGSATKKRTNREVYQFFHKRISEGTRHFKDFLGSDKNDTNK